MTPGEWLRNMAEAGPILVRLDAEMQEIVPKYLRNRAADCVALCEQARAGIFTEARRLGHNMKGNGGAYGFVEISRLGAQIEIAATHGDANALLVRHDGSFSDVMVRIGARVSVAVETTGATSMDDACAVNMAWLRGVIDLVAAR